MHRCVIYFRDGGKQRVELKRDRRGGESHFIDLYGGPRAINKIEIIGSRDYSKVLRVFDKGTVEFWGKLASNRYNDRYNDYDDYSYRGNNSYSSRERDRIARERALRERELARRERERIQRERARRSNVCPPPRRW